MNVPEKNHSMIVVSDITKNYGDIRAVKGVSFSVEEGEVFGLLGPNGAGKTTIIKILTTLSRPDSGFCRIDGLDVADNLYEVKRRIAVVPQENNLDRELTAYENLYLYGMLHGISDMGRIRRNLEIVGLWERKDSVVLGFSGGMQRRLLLARAMLSEPSVLFLDEPSVGLDPQIRRQLSDIIRKTKNDGRTVLITTHYIEEAEALCDRVGILSRGELIACDTPSYLMSTVGEYVVEFIDSGSRLIQKMFRKRDDANRFAQDLQQTVTIRKSSLEDVFVKLTGERIE